MMRHINGLAGCQKGEGAKELDDGSLISIRIVDCADEFIAVRVGTNPESARLTPEEARHFAMLLTEAADRADARA